MNHYELTVVVSGKLEEDAKNAALDRVKDMITRFGGEIKNVNEWGKKRFAYEVQKMKEGYYTFIKFDAAPEVPAEIESRMRIMDNVVRYLIVTDEYPDAIPEEKKEVKSAQAEASEENEPMDSAEEAPSYEAEEEAAPSEEADADEAPAEETPSEG